MTLTRTTTHKSHRAGPVELDEVGRLVQRCLRCDATLLIVVQSGDKPIRLGRRVMGKTVCQGSKGQTPFAEYVDE